MIIPKSGLENILRIDNMRRVMVEGNSDQVTNESEEELDKEIAIVEAQQKRKQELLNVYAERLPFQANR